MFAVAQFHEAMELRESGITQPILILGRLFPNDIPLAIRAGFRISIFGEEDLRWIEEAKQETRAPVHVKLETGMGRTGLLLDQAPALFDRLVQSRACLWEGLLSHFSTSDEQDKTYANQQLSRFKETLSLIRKLERKPTIIHMASSGAILDMPETYFNAVRPGILMYGHYPSRETTRSIEPKQVMTLKSFVAHLREMPEGHPISYGRLLDHSESDTNRRSSHRLCRRHQPQIDQHGQSAHSRQALPDGRQGNYGFHHGRRGDRSHRDRRRGPHLGFVAAGCHSGFRCR